MNRRESLKLSGIVLTELGFYFLGWRGQDQTPAKPLASLPSQAAIPTPDINFTSVFNPEPLPIIEATEPIHYTNPLPDGPEPIARNHGEIFRNPHPSNVAPPPLASPTMAPENLKSLREKYIWYGDRRKPFVALTFDDGWTASQIQRFTDILQETSVRLTVCPTGQAIENNRKLWLKLYQIGCEFGGHSYTHRKDFASLSVTGMVEEMGASQNSLDKALGRHVPYKFFRPPGGAMSWNMVEALKQTNQRGVIWSLSSEGTGTGNASTYVTNRILSQAKGGHITLHHFIEPDVSALKKIIEGLKAKGLTPVTLSEAL